jgi:hypothetical protein
VFGMQECSGENGGRNFRPFERFIRFFLVVAAKIKETNEADFFRVRKWTNRPKCDIVDTNPHASCAPGIIGTNNTAFLLYGSGLDKQKGGTHKKPNGHDFNGFRTCVVLRNFVLMGACRVLVGRKS